MIVLVLMDARPVVVKLVAYTAPPKVVVPVPVLVKFKAPKPVPEAPMAAKLMLAFELALVSVIVSATSVTLKALGMVKLATVEPEAVAQPVPAQV